MSRPRLAESYPKIIPTTYGKFLAVTADGLSPRIGVMGDSPKDAAMLFHFAALEWDKLLAQIPEVRASAIMPPPKPRKKRRRAAETWRRKWAATPPIVRAAGAPPAVDVT